MAPALSSTDIRLLAARPKGRTLEELASSLNLNADTLRRSVQSLSSTGLLSVSREETPAWEYTPAGADALAAGLPELALIRQLAGGPKPLSELGTESARMGIGMAMALRAKLIMLLPDKQVQLTEAGRAALADEAVYALPAPERLAGLPSERLAELRRRGLVSSRARISEVLTITAAGEAAADEEKEWVAVEKALDNTAAAQATEDALLDALAARDGTSKISTPINALSRDLLLSAKWKNRPLRRYDLSAPVAPHLPARRHPIARLREKVRSIFLSMGFEEMEGPLAESAFWNFDALFQPQDHPARDLADTFYLSGEAPRPPSKLSEAVKEAHEGGWHYDWSEKTARQMCLRTHTTSVSARTLAETASDPRQRKFFCIGKVFRNEATDYKHLAEFFQVEGIISWDGATFGHLLGTLKAFYAALGFEQIRFRPSYFPYTEPSLEVEVFHPARQAWLELGGAGVFRPEVCSGLGARYPVLAWGLSLERPLMMAHKIEDIRTLYRNDLGWLRNFPLAGV